MNTTSFNQISSWITNYNLILIYYNCVPAIDVTLNLEIITDFSATAIKVK